MASFRMVQGKTARVAFLTQSAHLFGTILCEHCLGLARSLAWQFVSAMHANKS